MFNMLPANPAVLASGSGMIKLPLGGTEFTYGIFRDAIRQFPDVFPDIATADSADHTLSVLLNDADLFVAPCTGINFSFFK